MSITTAEKEWLKRLGTNKPVRDDKLQTEEKPRNKEIRSNTTKAGKGFEDVAGMTQLKELVVEGFINVLKNKECAEAYGIKPPPFRQKMFFHNRQGRKTRDWAV